VFWLATSLLTSVFSRGNCLIHVSNNASVFRSVTDNALGADNDPEVQQYMRATIIKMFGEAIGQTITQRAARPNVPIEFQKLVAVNEDEEAACWR